jgi:hypothetical protein
MKSQPRQSAIAAKNAIWGRKEVNEVLDDEEEDSENSVADESDEGDENYSAVEDENDVESLNDSEADMEGSESEHSVVSNVNHDDLVGKDGEVWTLEPPTITGRAGAHNVIGKGGPTAECKKNVTNIPDTLDLFVTNQMIEMLVRFTNEEGIRTMGEQWKKTSSQEIRKYIGLLYMAGIFRSANESLISLWNVEHGRKVFYQTMSLHRMRELSQKLRFDSKDERIARRRNEKMAPIRDFFNLFVLQLPKYFKPFDSVTIDEQLVAFRGRCSFRQYMPNKPAKYGLKYFMMCCSSTYYVLGIIPYCGKDVITHSLAFDTVCKLIRPVENSGRNVTTDNFYTSLNLARELRRKKLTLVGTMRANKRELPPFVLQKTCRDVGSSRFCYKKEATLVSYFTKHKKVRMTHFTIQFYELNIARSVSVLF